MTCAGMTGSESQDDTLTLNSYIAANSLAILGPLPGPYAKNGRQRPTLHYDALLDGNRTTAVPLVVTSPRWLSPQISRSTRCSSFS